MPVQIRKKRTVSQAVKPIKTVSPEVLKAKATAAVARKEEELAHAKTMRFYDAASNAIIGGGQLVGQFQQQARARAAQAPEGARDLGTDLREEYRKTDMSMTYAQFVQSKTGDSAYISGYNARHPNANLDEKKFQRYAKWEANRGDGRAFELKLWGRVADATIESFTPFSEVDGKVKFDSGYLDDAFDNPRIQNLAKHMGKKAIIERLQSNAQRKLLQTAVNQVSADNWDIPRAMKSFDVMKKAGYMAGVDRAGFQVQVLTASAQGMATVNRAYAERSKMQARRKLAPHLKRAGFADTAGATQFTTQDMARTFSDLDRTFLTGGTTIQRYRTSANAAIDRAADPNVARQYDKRVAQMTALVDQALSDGVATVGQDGLIHMLAPPGAYGKPKTVGGTRARDDMFNQFARRYDEARGKTGGLVGKPADSVQSTMVGYASDFFEKLGVSPSPGQPSLSSTDVAVAVDNVGNLIAENGGDWRAFNRAVRDPSEANLAAFKKSVRKTMSDTDWAVLNRSNFSAMTADGGASGAGFGGGGDMDDRERESVLSRGLEALNEAVDTGKKWAGKAWDWGAGFFK